MWGVSILGDVVSRSRFREVPLSGHGQPIRQQQSSTASLTYKYTCDSVFTGSDIMKRRADLREEYFMAVLYIHLSLGNVRMMRVQSDGGT